MKQYGDLVSITKLMFEKNEMLLRFGNNYQINVLKNEKKIT